MQGTIGISAAEVKTSSEGPAFKLGTIAFLNTADSDTPPGDAVFMYVCAAEAITGAGYLCVVDSGFQAEMVDTTSSAAGAGQGRPCGAAQAAVASGGYGWLQIYGKGSLRTSASAAVGTELNATATAGEVDDDASAGAEVIAGLSLGTATGGSAAVNTDAFFNYPYVGRTL